MVCSQTMKGNASFYLWRATSAACALGGCFAVACRATDASLISQMTTLEQQHRRPKRMDADLSMQAELLKEALGGRRLGRPWPGRQMHAFAVGQRREMADPLVAQTDDRKPWGFCLCFLHLRNVKGDPWNPKRVCPWPVRDCLQSPQGASTAG